MWRVDSKKGAWKQGHYWNSASVVQEEIMWLGLDGPCVDGSKWSDWRYSLMAQTGLVRCDVWGKGRKQRCLLGFGLEPWEEQNCHLLRRREGQEAQFPSGRGRFEMFIQHLPEMGYRQLDRWAGAGRRGSGWETQTQAWTPLDGIWSHGTRSDHQGGKRTPSPEPWALQCVKMEKTEIQENRLR